MNIKTHELKNSFHFYHTNTELRLLFLHIAAQQRFVFYNLLLQRRRMEQILTIFLPNMQANINRV